MKSEDGVSSIQAEEGFNKRYSDDVIDPSILDGCTKMIESYFLENKVEKKVQSPINHPANLDQVIEQGMGFHAYCQTFEVKDSMVIAFLSIAFSDFMIRELGFKLYKDEHARGSIAFNDFEI